MDDKIIGFISAAMFLAACFLLQARLTPDTKVSLSVELKALHGPVLLQQRWPFLLLSLPSSFR